MWLVVLLVALAGTALFMLLLLLRMCQAPGYVDKGGPRKGPTSSRVTPINTIIMRSLAHGPSVVA